MRQLGVAGPSAGSTAGAARASVAAPLPDLADVAEVATWLHTTPKAIYAMVERGQLAGVIRVGKRVLFDRAALVHWLAERRAPSPKEPRR